MVILWEPGPVFQNSASLHSSINIFLLSLSRITRQCRDTLVSFVERHTEHLLLNTSAKEYYILIIEICKFYFFRVLFKGLETFHFKICKSSMPIWSTIYFRVKLLIEKYIYIAPIDKI